MYWNDRSGNSNLLEVVESECDFKHYEARNDTGMITDKKKLPILGFSYGHFDHGSARIIVGPLTCSSGKVFFQENPLFPKRTFEFNLHYFFVVINTG